MKIYLIRHGQTDLNKEGKLQGKKGLPLNSQGINQAKELKNKLKSVKFDVVFSSPQERAIQTAEIASGTKAIIDNRIDVFDLGTADGLKKEEVRTLNGLIPDPSVYFGVENIQDYIKRVYSFMNDLCNQYKDKDVNILICGHKCTTGCISAYLEGMPKDGNFLKLSSSNGEYKSFDLNKNKERD